MATLNLVITDKNELLFLWKDGPLPTDDSCLLDLDLDHLPHSEEVSWEIVPFLKAVKYDTENACDESWSARKKIMLQLIHHSGQDSKDLAERVFKSVPSDFVLSILGDVDDETGVAYETGQIVSLGEQVEDIAVYMDDSAGYLFVGDTHWLMVVKHKDLVREFDESSNKYVYRTEASPKQ